ncbi:MAG: O-antigen ligase family protein [Sedimentisphaerales bacterium]|nr:O-antigen ligase family protein [Sedimentisphaerales bacterium]
MIARIEDNMSDVYASPFDKAIEWLLITLLAFMPFVFGAVEAWSEQIVITLAGAISLCFLLKLIYEKHTRIIWTWAYVPLALFIAVVIFQLIPWPTRIIGALSPSTVLMKKELLGDVVNSEDLLRSMTLSFYPYATKHDLRLVLAVTAVFFVIVNIYRRTEQVKRLLVAITVIGALVAVLALGQDILGNGKIYWLVSPGRGNAYSGPFVNHSHYAQFMNLSLGAALGLLFLKIQETFGGQRIAAPVVFQHLLTPRTKPLWLLVGMIMLCVTTVFLSLSRGGMVSMFVAAGITTLVLSTMRSIKGRGWIMGLIAFGAFICILYVGFDAVYDRLASLRDLQHVEGGRWQIVKDIFLAWTQFPVLGTGLGTHEVVYPMFDRSMSPLLAAYAENEYAQVAEETGLIGLFLLVGFGMFVWVNYVRSLKNTPYSIRPAVFGLGFGLLAIMLHSLSDFGQHVPANAMLSATFCALLLSLSRFHLNIDPAVNIARVSHGSKSLRILMLVCISGFWTWMFFNANNARLAENRWKETLSIEHKLAEKGWQAGDNEYIALISNAADAAEYQPENVKYNHWLNVYRWESLRRIPDRNDGSAAFPEEAMVFIRRIVDELHHTRLLCPTYGATCCVVGQIEFFTLNDPNGADRIRKGYRLAPCDPTACFVAGRLDLEEQRIEASFEKFSQAVQLDGRFFEPAVDMYVNYTGHPDLAVALAGDDIYRLSRLANVLVDVNEHKDIVKQTKERVFELLQKKCTEIDAPASAFASLASLCREEDDEAAIEHYRRALDMDYSQIRWRFALARLLAKTGKISDAIHEARICLRLSPQFKEAERFIADLSILPVAKGEQNPAP